MHDELDKNYEVNKPNENKPEQKNRNAPLQLLGWRSSASLLELAVREALSRESSKFCPGTRRIPVPAQKKRHKQSCGQRPDTQAFFSLPPGPDLRFRLSHTSSQEPTCIGTAPYP